MESLEADIEALKEDNKGTDEILQQFTQQLIILVTRLPHETPQEQTQRQLEPQPLQNLQQREGIYKPNCQTELPNFNEFEWLSTYLPNIPTEILEHTYLKGLKLEIQSELSVQAYWVA
ncbi:unnamed protein product [Spirodela intermedia]|uniref:Uncharacterized protein n=2 Tax=Spirodela intermedia TaxID=51605 RepID=A0A7I8JC70_SPIIN|nr:unnamed protein product [Spirodela intermedia]CAA6667720.1 unnamed protein product [Spirodela intermedia]CAA7404531.1 unnamed protein product [Spirodela intermedia]